MRRSLVAMSLFAALVALASTASAQDWPMAGGDPSRTGATASEPSAFPGIAWEMGLGGGLASDPIVEGAHAIAVSGGTPTVNALDASTGEVAWTFDLGDFWAPPATVRGYNATPAVDASSVYVLHTVRTGTADEHVDVLFALARATGQFTWFANGTIYSSPGDPGVLSSPLLVRNLVVFGSGDGHVRAVYAANGTVAWDADLGSPVRSPTSLLPLGVLGDFVLAGDGAGNVHALDLDGQGDGDDGTNDPPGSTGDVVWTAALGTEVAAAPIGTEDAAFVGAGADLFALNPVWGSLLWTRALAAEVSGPIALHTTAAGTHVVLSTAEGLLWSVSAATGEPAWVRLLPGMRPWLVSTPTRIFTAAATADPARDEILSVNGTTGDTVWSGTFPGPIAHGSVAADVLYVGLGGPPRLVAFGGTPDLSVRAGDISLTPIPNPNVYQADVEATVRNAGDAPAVGPFTIVILDVLSGTPTEIGNVTVASLAPGNSTRVAVGGWNFSRGSHEVRVVVAAVPGERSTANNVASVAFVASAGPPQVETQWPVSFTIAVLAVGAVGAALGWLAAVAKRRRERDVEAMIRERGARP